MRNANNHISPHMRKFFIFLMVFFATFIAAAQDVIVKNDNSTILCRIVEVNNNEVVYLKWSDLNGPRYIMDRSLIANINYQNGRQDKLNPQTSNAYAPSNQQTGIAQYNDNMLYSMDIARSNYHQKIKILKIVGWTVGGLGVAGGAILILATDTFRGGGGPEFYVPAFILMGGGLAATTICLVKANHLQKVSQSLNIAHVFQKEFNLGNRESLCAGVDIIRDGLSKKTTLGLGLQYNF